MLKIIFISIFIIFSSYAQECHKSVLNPVNPLEEIMEVIQFHAVSDENVKNAKCLDNQIPFGDELYSHIGSFREKVSKKVNGVEFENEDPKLIELFEKLTKKPVAIEILDNEVHEKFNKTNVQEDFKINPYCKKVRCAVEKIWDKGVGEKLLYMLFEFDLNGSQISYDSIKGDDKLRPLKNHELEQIIKAANALPKELFPIDKNATIVHNADPRNYGKYADARIMLFDLWDGQSAREKQYTIFHEMAHNLGDKLAGLDKSKEWLGLSGWKKINDSPIDIYNYSIDDENTKHICSTYGTKNPIEDFAESVSAYRYNPFLLQKVNPKKYDFIKKNVFYGREFTKKDFCQNLPVAIEDKFAKIYLSKKRSVPKEEIKKECSALIDLSFSKEKMESCYSKVIFDQLIKKIDDNDIKEFLDENSLKVSQYNIEQLKKSVNKNKKTDLIVYEKARELASIESEKTRKEYLALLEKAKEYKITKEVMNKKSYFLKKCSKEVLKQSQAIKDCIQKAVFQEEDIFDDLSNNFTNETKRKIEKEYNTILAKASIDENDFVDYKNTVEKKIVELETSDFIRVSYELNWNVKKSEWKKLLPQDFCRKYYKQMDYSYIIAGLDNTKDIQKIIEKRVFTRCVQIQKTSKKRFPITKELYLKYY
ncbi:MAG: hypothetical protein N4A33_12130 [Bacteriovoracaceae bacterium]|jgi:hypothetical protein|nr:hypothetical protein [Bacteriovoracaceae bacterium]